MTFKFFDETKTSHIAKCNSHSASTIDCILFQNSFNFPTTTLRHQSNGILIVLILRFNYNSNANNVTIFVVLLLIYY